MLLDILRRSNLFLRKQQQINHELRWLSIIGNDDGKCVVFVDFNHDPTQAIEKTMETYRKSSKRETGYDWLAFFFTTNLGTRSSCWLVTQDSPSHQGRKLR